MNVIKIHHIVFFTVLTVLCCLPDQALLAKEGVVNDYYHLANGSKKSFSRKKDHYMIILDENAEKKEDKFKSEKFRKKLSAKFPDGAEVLSVKSDLHAIVKAKGSDNTKTILFFFRMRLAYSNAALRDVREDLGSR